MSTLPIACPGSDKDTDAPPRETAKGKTEGWGEKGQRGVAGIRGVGAESERENEREEKRRQ